MLPRSPSAAPTAEESYEAMNARFIVRNATKQMEAQDEEADRIPLGACPSSRGVFGTNLIPFGS
jgi:hypothetical protein